MHTFIVGDATQLQSYQDCLKLQIPTSRSETCVTIQTVHLTVQTGNWISVSSECNFYTIKKAYDFHYEVD